MTSEGSDGEEFHLPVTEGGVIRLTPRLRETYLDPETDERDAIVQAVGPYLRISIWSQRENVTIDVPFDGFRAERPYQRSLSRWGVNASRYMTPGRKGGAVGWNNDASLDVKYGGDSAKPLIEATVRTFEGDAPDVV